MINKICRKTNDWSCCIDSLKVGDIELTDPSKITNEFASYFSTVSDKYSKKLAKSNKAINDYICKITYSNSSLYLTPCTPIELDIIIHKLPNKNSSGYDQISNVFLKKINHSILPILCELINESISSGTFPTITKHTEVVPLFKSGDRKQSTNYRPISLLITISKLLEKIVYKRTYSFLNNTNQLYISQYGFRSKHSCENTVTKLISEIVKNQLCNKHTIAVFLDLSKAFDTLQHDILFRKLEKYGIRSTSLSWFKRLSYRT